MANSAVAKVTIHVGGQAGNQFPASGEDSYTVQAGQTLTVEATSGILANDSDAEGSPLTAQLVAGTAHGTLVLNPDGSFSYIPEAGFSGSDSFTYQASDGAGVGNIATVTLTVTPEGTTVPIEAAGDAYQVAAETTLTVDLPGVLANDTDAEGDALTATLVAGPTSGTVTLNADGSFSYTPAVGFAGSDSFTYQAGDGANMSNIATVTIEVGSLDNTRPEAGNDSYIVESGQTLEVPAEEGVLLDDADPDGDAITAALFSAPLHGTVTLAEDGSFSYTPEAGYVGMDSFIYWVFDGELHSALAAVTIHVEAAEDPGEAPLPGEDDECEDDALLDMIVAGDMDTGAIDDLLADNGWLA
jgi:VCBS repeat-containing protein